MTPESSKGANFGSGHRAHRRAPPIHTDQEMPRNPPIRTGNSRHRESEKMSVLYLLNIRCTRTLRILLAITATSLSLSQIL